MNPIDEADGPRQESGCDPGDNEPEREDPPKISSSQNSNQVRNDGGRQKPQRERDEHRVDRMPVNVNVRLHKASRLSPTPAPGTG